MSGLKVGTTQVPHQKKKKKDNPGPGARGNQFALEDRYLCTNVMAWTPYRMHVASRQLSSRCSIRRPTLQYGLAVRSRVGKTGEEPELAAA